MTIQNTSLLGKQARSARLIRTTPEILRYFASLLEQAAEGASGHRDCVLVPFTNSIEFLYEPNHSENSIRVRTELEEIRSIPQTVQG